MEKVTKLFRGKFNKNIDIPEPFPFLETKKFIIPRTNLVELSAKERLELISKITSKCFEVETYNSSNIDPNILNLKGEIISNEKHYRTFFKPDLLKLLDWKVSTKKEEGDRVIIGEHPTKNKTAVFTSAYSGEYGNLVSKWGVEATISLKSVFSQFGVQKQPLSGKGKDGKGRVSFISNYWFEIMEDAYGRPRLWLCIDYHLACMNPSKAKTTQRNLKKNRTKVSKKKPVQENIKIMAKQIFNAEIDNIDTPLLMQLSKELTMLLDERKMSVDEIQTKFNIPISPVTKLQ